MNRFAVEVTSSAKLRSLPNTTKKSIIILQLLPGDRLVVSDILGDKWWYCEVISTEGDGAGKKGWIYNRYAQPIEMPLEPILGPVAPMFRWNGNGGKAHLAIIAAFVFLFLAALLSTAARFF
jgi:hypothetical protein